MDENLAGLFEKYVNNSCTAEEMDRLFLLIADEHNLEVLDGELKDLWKRRLTADGNGELNLDEKFSQLMEKAGSGRHTASIRKKIRPRIWYAAAAGIALIIAVSGFLSQKKSGVQSALNPVAAQTDVQPGNNKAVLTLADGSSILLDSSLNGKLAIQGNTEILKSGGKLSYVNSSLPAAKTVFNTITTPKGGQYQLVLSDGTRVWLNAASSLVYPTAFTGRERKVILKGEGYFEVARDETKPFKVEVNAMEVEVLGTHFNINSYQDESDIRTTLLEGSVKILQNGNSKILKPGQQASLNKSGQLKINEYADLEEAVAWKEGRFQFEKANIYAIMRQIERWYDVDVSYEGNVSAHFVGTISRQVNLSQVLNMLQLTGEVQFRIKDKKVTVMPPTERK